MQASVMSLFWSCGPFARAVRLGLSRSLLPIVAHARAARRSSQAAKKRMGCGADKKEENPAIFSKRKQLSCSSHLSVAECGGKRLRTDCGTNGPRQLRWASIAEIYHSNRATPNKRSASKEPLVRSGGSFSLTQLAHRGCKFKFGIAIHPHCILSLADAERHQAGLRPAGL